jgi:hypothetical protein
MAGIEKNYYSLEELENHWGLPRRDLIYLAENGLLRLSVRLYGIQIERGRFEVDGGQRFRIPEEQLLFQGLLDLLPDDAYRLFHDSHIKIQQFDSPDESYCHVLHPEDGVVVTKGELVIRREERDRAEAKHGLGGVPRTTATLFAQKNDFAEVTLGDLTFTLGPLQARVVRILSEVADTGSPWCHGKQVLADAGSSGARLSDLFKTQPKWRKLIQSDGRGKYRLNIKFS